MREIWVDFNSVDAHGLATTLLSFVEKGVSLSNGLKVLAGDDEGHLCEATVVDIATNGVVTLALDAGTFSKTDQQARIAI